MSLIEIQRYRAEIEQLARFTGTRNESTLRQPFQELLAHYARAKGLLVVAEVEYLTATGRKVYPDGTLKDALRQDWGFWESKDEKDDLEAEIAAKLARGYPNFNILFEDTRTAALYQSGAEVARADFANEAALDALLQQWVSYEPPAASEFHQAIALFSAEVPRLAATLRVVIEDHALHNDAFKVALAEFLDVCRKTINPKVEPADARQMIIQHVLTEDIFIRVFGEAEFHRENVIAHKLTEVAGMFYTGLTKRQIQAKIAPYYTAIHARAAQISDHHEKQKFLKALYENFYRAYNPKAADRLGIVYTPDEVARFMIHSADQLVFEHFGSTLGSPGVEILDPATGTGTFITELIEYLPAHQLPAKYAHEIHCNEVSILPYYIASLNIEYTYKQKMGEYAPYNNICFVDTLENLGFERADEPQANFFRLVDENVERINRQNTRRISVILGNPPYNTNQMNENENNKNREYPIIDQRIKKTYIKHSTAQKTKLYDMYARFIRWASDRLAPEGVIAFVSNNSFLNARSYDGFRKVVAEEFSDIYIVDLKGDARTSGKQRRKEGGNIFSDQIRVGIAIYFLVRRAGQRRCRIHYTAVSDYATADDKKRFLRLNRIDKLPLQVIQPDKQNNWINLAATDWPRLLPIASKSGKALKAEADPKTIFKVFSPGIVTARDGWLTDFSAKQLAKKVKFFINFYNRHKRAGSFDATIKWSRNLKRRHTAHQTEPYDAKQIITYAYRPFVSRQFYYSEIFLDETGWASTIPPNSQVIAFANPSSPQPFHALASNTRVDLHFTGDTQYVPRYYKLPNGKRTDNITDWALDKFQKHYKKSKVTKDKIFAYVYAVLHHPAYRVKYEANLKREFPRIPFYKDFEQWANWGEALLALHLNFEETTPYPLKREDKKSTLPPAPRLLARQEAGVIEIDSHTTLHGVPPEAWQYRLGTYTALEWVLERYKERKPKDPTLREKFDTYRLSDYKEAVIALLGQVCAVSVETMKSIAAMPEEG